MNSDRVIFTQTMLQSASRADGSAGVRYLDVKPFAHRDLGVADLVELLNFAKEKRGLDCIRVGGVFYRACRECVEPVTGGADLCSWCGDIRVQSFVEPTDTQQDLVHRAARLERVSQQLMEISQHLTNETPKTEFTKPLQIEDVSAAGALIKAAACGCEISARTGLLHNNARCTQHGPLCVRCNGSHRGDCRPRQGEDPFPTERGGL